MEHRSLDSTLAQSLRDADPTKRFSNRVDFYVRARPRYPDALLQFLKAELALSSVATIADIGSGTGRLTELFVRNGNPTFAVEPNAEMRSAGESHLSKYPNFHSINGSAEATTLPNSSVDFLTAAQSFHWFDPVKARKEFARIIKPAGFVILVWNERSNAASPFARQYGELMAQYKTKLNSVKQRFFPPAGESELAHFFNKAGYQTRAFENPQSLDQAGFLDRICSSSYMPLPDDPRYPAMLQRATAIFDGHQIDGKVIIPQESKVFFGRPA